MTNTNNVYSALNNVDWFETCAINKHISCCPHVIMDMDVFMEELSKNFEKFDFNHCVLAYNTMSTRSLYDAVSSFLDASIQMFDVPSSLSLLIDWIGAHVWSFIQDYQLAFMCQQAEKTSHHGFTCQLHVSANSVALFIVISVAVTLAILLAFSGKLTVVVRKLYAMAICVLGCIHTTPKSGGKVGGMSPQLVVNVNGMQPVGINQESSDITKQIAHCVTHEISVALGEQTAVLRRMEDRLMSVHTPTPIIPVHMEDDMMSAETDPESESARTVTPRCKRNFSRNEPNVLIVDMQTVRPQRRVELKNTLGSFYQEGKGKMNKKGTGFVNSSRVPTFHATINWSGNSYTKAYLDDEGREHMVLLNYELDDEEYFTRTYYRLFDDYVEDNADFNYDDQDVMRQKVAELQNEFIEILNKAYDDRHPLSHEETIERFNYAASRLTTQEAAPVSQDTIHERLAAMLQIFDKYPDLRKKYRNHTARLLTGYGLKKESQHTFSPSVIFDGEEISDIYTLIMKFIANKQMYDRDVVVFLPQVDASSTDSSDMTFIRTVDGQQESIYKVFDSEVHRVDHFSGVNQPPVPYVPARVSDIEKKSKAPIRSLETCFWKRESLDTVQMASKAPTKLPKDVVDMINSYRHRCSVCSKMNVELFKDYNVHYHRANNVQKLVVRRANLFKDGSTTEELMCSDCIQAVGCVYCPICEREAISNHRNFYNIGSYEVAVQPYRNGATKHSDFCTVVRTVVDKTKTTCSICRISDSITEDDVLCNRNFSSIVKKKIPANNKRYSICSMCIASADVPHRNERMIGGELTIVNPLTEDNRCERCTDCGTHWNTKRSGQIYPLSSKLTGKYYGYDEVWPVNLLPFNDATTLCRSSGHVRSDIQKCNICANIVRKTKAFEYDARRKWEGDYCEPKYLGPYKGRDRAEAIRPFPVDYHNVPQSTLLEDLMYAEDNYRSAPMQCSAPNAETPASKNVKSSRRRRRTVKEDESNTRTVMTNKPEAISTNIEELKSQHGLLCDMVRDALAKIDSIGKMIKRMEKATDTVPSVLTNTDALRRDIKPISTVGTVKSGNVPQSPVQEAMLAAAPALKYDGAQVILTYNNYSCNGTVTSINITGRRALVKVITVAHYNTATYPDFDIVESNSRGLKFPHNHPLFLATILKSHVSYSNNEMNADVWFLLDLEYVLDEAPDAPSKLQLECNKYIIPSRRFDGSNIIGAKVAVVTLGTKSTQRTVSFGRIQNQIDIDCGRNFRFDIDCSVVDPDSNMGPGSSGSLVYFQINNGAYIPLSLHFGSMDKHNISYNIDATLTPIPKEVKAFSS